MHFRDEAGRTLVLRGVNLADGKFPLGKPTYHLESFDNAESCSYINTFFTLPDDPNPVTHNLQNGSINGTTTTPSHAADAHTHLTRLSYLGFNILRIPVPWEALEHAGPGQYDDEYISYITRLVRLASSPPYNFRVIINPHQDLWSRHCGGSGAPLWTVHACGLDPAGFGETGACVRYAEWPLKHELQNVDDEDGNKADTEKRPQDIPPMMWTTNHNRLATMTIFALFFAGREVAPKCRLRYKPKLHSSTNGTTTRNGTSLTPAAAQQQQADNGHDDDDDNGYENIQDFLLRHYLAAYARLFSALGDLPFAYDSINEPEPGYIGLTDLSTIERENTAKIGSTPTPIESMRLGMGMEQTVDEYRLGKTGPHKSGRITIVPKRSCWLNEEDERWECERDSGWNLGTCIWAQHGVWDAKSGELLRKDYFEKVLPFESDAATEEENHGKGRLSFVSSYWQEFHRLWMREIRRYTNKAVVFLQPCVFEEPPPRDARGARRDSGTGEQLNGACDERIGYSPHYYDGLTVMHRHWHQSWNADVVGLLRGKHRTKVTGLRVGQNNVRKAIGSQLGILASDLPHVPTIIGEMGIPFNLDDGQAYRPKGEEGAGDYREHVKALDAMLSGCDEHFLSYTLWAYSAINTNQWGEHWNGEDLSIYCAETRSFEGHGQLEGFRAAQAWCRPFVRSYDGKIIKMDFDVWESRFEVEIEIDAQQDGNTEKAYAEVYVPWVHFGGENGSDQLELVVEASKGTVWSLKAPQLLRWEYGGYQGGKVHCRISRRSRPRSEKDIGTIVY